MKWLNMELAVNYATQLFCSTCLTIIYLKPVLKTTWWECIKFRVVVETVFYLPGFF